jgi:hypothetical protein
MPSAVMAASVAMAATVLQMALQGVQEAMVVAVALDHQSI